MYLLITRTGSKEKSFDSLADFSSMDIGVIYLRASDTTFDFKGAKNQFAANLKPQVFT
jgi:hypothetical protein